MKIMARLVGVLVVTACAAPGADDGHRRDTAVTDFIEVNELVEQAAVRSLDQLEAREINDRFVIVSTRREDYLLLYYSRCIQGVDGRIVPDVRQDSRALYAGVDTFRGCRIKAIYRLAPGQAEELLELGRAVGGAR